MDYKQATKQKLRFPTNLGGLTTEQLWDLTLPNLDVLAQNLSKQLDLSGEKSYITKTKAKDKTVKLMLDIVVDIIETKLEEKEEKNNAKNAKDHNQKIEALIAEKEDDELKDKSVEELKKMLK